MSPDEQRAYKLGQEAAPFLEFVCLSAISIAVYLPVCLGGRSLQRGTGHGLGVTAAILAMIPASPAWLVGMPVGIYALSVLTSEEIKAAVFRR
jgi:hypothetical protein